MTSGGYDVKVEGLADYVRELRTIDRALPKAVSKGLRVLAKEAAAKAKARGLSRGGVAAKTVRKGGIGYFAQQRQAGLKLRYRKVPYAAGAEFGSKRYKQFRPWRGNQWQPVGSDGVGYFVHPAIRDYLPTAEATYADLIADAIDDYLKEVT